MKKKKIIKFKEKGIIPLRDLAPIDNIMGGSGKILFGERIDSLEEHDLNSKRKIKRRHTKE